MKVFLIKSLGGLLSAAVLSVLFLVQFATPVAAQGFQVTYSHPMEMLVPESGSGTVEFTILNPDFTGEIRIDVKHIPLDYEPKRVSVVAGEDKHVVVTFHGNEELESVHFTGKIVITPVSNEMFIGGYMIPIGTIHQVGDEPVMPGFFLDVLIKPAGSGSITLDPPVGLYQSGKEVTLTAVPNSGWEFDSWTGDNAADLADPTSATTTIIMDSDKEVTANFIRIPPTTYYLTMAVSGNGTTTPAVGVYTCEEGSVVPITATPGEGWYFVNWTGGVDDPDSASTAVSMDGDKTVTANFDRVANNPPIASIVTIEDQIIPLPVTVKVTPQVLNLDRMGKWVKVHIFDDSKNTLQQMEITLDGSGSSDPEGEPLTYDWTLTGPEGNIPVDDAAIATVTLSAGTYTATLVVNDGTVSSEAASVTFILDDETIGDLAMADPGDFTLNGVPASEVKGGNDCLVVSFDNDAIAATVAVGPDVEMTVEGRVSGIDYIDVIQDKADNKDKGNSDLKVPVINEAITPGQDKGLGKMGGVKAKGK